MPTLLINATIVLRDSVIPHGWLLIESDLIASIGAMPYVPMMHGATVRDLAGAYIIPGVIDLHCDTIEKMVQPRPGVEINGAVALHITDRLLINSGVTCEFHSLSLDDAEFGVRNEDFIQNFINEIKRADHASVRHYVHARVEISSARGAYALRNIIDQPEVKLVSLMDHSPGQGQYVTDESFRYYVAKTTGRNDAEIDEIIRTKAQLKAGIPERIDYVVQLCRNAHIPIATHDDDTAQKIAMWVEMGIGISEFPTTMEAAAAAHNHGMLVGMGAPNVLRGRSSGGNLSATDAIRAGYVDWLCADYYPAALIPAAFTLVDQGLLDLPSAIALITANPAQAIGMEHHIGQIAVGLSADLVVIKRTPQPIVRDVYVAGVQVLASQAAPR